MAYNTIRECISRMCIEPSSPIAYVIRWIGTLTLCVTYRRVDTGFFSRQHIYEFMLVYIIVVAHIRIYRLPYSI